MTLRPTFVLLFASFGLFTSCASTMESENVRHSGFLTNYDRLEEGDRGGMRWFDPSFKLRDYDSCHLPKIEFRLTDENKEELKPEDAGRLAGMFHEQAIKKLGDKGWKIVDAPGDKTMTIRLALTELNGANPYGNVVTGVTPYLRPAMRLLAITADVHAFVGEVSVELQIVDSSSGKVLAEALDRRVGAQSVWNIGSTWADVEDAIGVWTDRLADAFSKMDKETRGEGDKGKDGDDGKKGKDGEG